MALIALKEIGGTSISEPKKNELLNLLLGYVGENPEQFTSEINESITTALNDIFKLKDLVQQKLENIVETLSTTYPPETSSPEKEQPKEEPQDPPFEETQDASEEFQEVLPKEPQDTFPEKSWLLIGKGEGMVVGSSDEFRGQIARITVNRRSDDETSVLLEYAIKNDESSYRMQAFQRDVSIQSLCFPSPKLKLFGIGQAEKADYFGNVLEDTVNFNLAVWEASPNQLKFEIEIHSGEEKLCHNSGVVSNYNLNLAFELPCP